MPGSKQAEGTHKTNDATREEEHCSDKDCAHPEHPELRKVLDGVFNQYEEGRAHYRPEEEPCTAQYTHDYRVSRPAEVERFQRYHAFERNQEGAGKSRKESRYRERKEQMPPHVEAKKLRPFAVIANCPEHMAEAGVDNDPQYERPKRNDNE